MTFLLFKRLRDSRRVFSTDLEVQLLLKQGQVEVDPGAFIPNYKTALLIHREVVEDLNKRIRVGSLFVHSILAFAIIEWSFM